MNIQLISAIIKGVWAIDEISANGYASLVYNILSGTTNVEVVDQPEILQAFAASGSVSGSSLKEAPENSIAVINMNGPLMKNSQACGPVGMARIGENIKAADKHPNIKAIVLNIDSPGGTVDGTQELAEIVKATNKPVVSYVNGLMASAALWIGSGAVEIMASTELAKVGSIGAVSTIKDFLPALEKLGVKEHNIKASKSQDKNKFIDQIREGNYDEYRQKILDPARDAFANAVKENRPNIKEEHLTGEIYCAADVMGVIVDSIGTLENAIQRASDLADEQTSGNSNQKNITMKKQFLNVNSVLNIETMESNDEENVSLNAEQLELIDNALDQGSQAQETATQNQAEVDRLTTENATLQDDIKTANTTIEDLKKASGAAAQVVIDDDAEGKQTDVISSAKELFNSAN